MLGHELAQLLGIQVWGKTFMETMQLTNLLGITQLRFKIDAFWIYP